MATTRLTFNEWTPDKPGVVGNMTDVANTYPVSSGYSFLLDKANFSNAASETLKYVFAGRSANESLLFAASDSKIFKFDQITQNMTNVSKAGGYTNVVIDTAQFGNKLIASNGAQRLQSWTIGSSSAWADLSATAPIAKYVTVVRDFVVTGNQSSAESRVQWSDINDETDWTSGAASQSDYQDIPDGGDIIGITGGEFGLVLLQNSIHRMTYVGSPLFFQFDNISRGIGCFANGSIAQYRQITFFLASNGFYMCDGQSVTPIGNEKIDRWFFNNVDLSEIDNMSTQVDPERKLVIWNFRNANAGYYQLMYQWELSRWSYSDINITSIGGALASGFTLEQLDAYGTVDSIQVSFDSRQWAGGKFFLAATSGNSIVSLDGARLTPNLITGDLQSQDPNSVVTLLRPVIDNGAANVSVASRRKLDDPITFGTTVASDADGRATLRSAGKFHRIQVVPTGNWNTAVGIDVELVSQGMR